uniref:Fibronectin type III domain protein n=1 Tax=Angiostrongylus cantonensis TaxID=6313 RepID=A0A158P825_ANGCA
MTRPQLKEKRVHCGGFIVISESLRLRRESRGTESLLTVEWEGIQTGDHSDSDVKGFLVEYRAEKDKHWMVHSGIIPYKGPNHQYRVQIPKLPTGVAYFVRIKVLGSNNEILVETAEIRARNEIVSIKCESDDITPPRHLEVTHEGQYSIAIKWDVPECGSIGEYQVELIGEESPFDVHRQTVTQPHVSVTNLLPATSYNVKWSFMGLTLLLASALFSLSRIRAVDRQRRIGPWNTDLLQAKTQGKPVSISNAIRLVYRTDSELRITWEPISDERAQHYEVMAVEVLPDSRRVERARVPSHVFTHTLAGLLPDTKYLIGVIAFVDHEPKQVYNLEAQTYEEPSDRWNEKPQEVHDECDDFRWSAAVTKGFPCNGECRPFRNQSVNSLWNTDFPTREVEKGVEKYSVSLPEIEDALVFNVRVIAIGDTKELIARTDEVTIGVAAANACIGPAGIPTKISLLSAEATQLRFSWNKPNCDESVAPIDGYEYLIHESQQGVPHSGASYTGGTQVTITDLRPSTRYSFRLRSRNANGHSPWSEVIRVTTQPEGSHAVGIVQPPELQVSITQPRIEQQGPRNVVYWSTSGDTSHVLGYQVDIRRTGDRDWMEHGTVVRSEPSQSHFRQSLGAMPVATYYLRVRAIDNNGITISTSPSTSFLVSCQVPTTPENVRLDRVSDEVVRISWTFPNDDPACQTFFFITGVQNGTPISHRVQGSGRSFDINAPAKGDWRVEVSAVNSAGSGPASREAIFTSAQQFIRSALVSTPRVTARGNDLLVEWRSEGDGRGVFGYRVQFRTESSGWNPYGQIVPYVGDNQDYSQTLTGLQQGHTYSVHIQVLDRNSYVMYVSPEASARSSCTAPSHPPSHLQVQAPDASHVRVHWAVPPQSTWGCADIEFEIQVDQPRGVQPVTVAGTQTSHIFTSQPNQQWSIRMRAKNMAGHSAWTALAEARTSPGGELIVGPNVAYRQGNPIITWQSRENVDGLIDNFIVQWKATTEWDWRQHSNPIPYSGSQRPYSIDLGELPKGHTYQVRVIVKDHNRGTAFTSPIVQVQTQSTCQPPRRSPSNLQARFLFRSYLDIALLQVSPIGPTQIRLTWAPLHESEWNCDRIWYIVKYSTPKNQGFKNLTQGENSVVFESDPYTKWNFEVQAANPAGETQWSRTETAQTQDASPGPVVDFRVQPVGPDRLQVSWRPPLNPNGLITQYEVTYQLISNYKKENSRKMIMKTEMKSSLWLNYRGMCDQQQDVPLTISTTSPHHVITGLHPHSRYRVGVAARTTIAGERVSQEVQTEQSVPSAPPTYLRVDEARENDASISWQAPPCLQTNGEITEYEYEVTPADRRTAPQRIADNVRGTRTHVTNLEPFTQYNVKVCIVSALDAVI